MLLTCSNIFRPVRPNPSKSCVVNASSSALREPAYTFSNSVEESEGVDSCNGLPARGRIRCKAVPGWWLLDAGYSWMILSMYCLHLGSSIWLPFVGVYCCLRFLVCCVLIRFPTVCRCRCQVYAVCCLSVHIVHFLKF